MPNNTEEDQVKEFSAREKWKSTVDYFFSVFGAAVGLGNIWRFPYLCYNNGGGVFLIAYLILLLALVFPLIVLESAIGQLTGMSSIKAWGIVPLSLGIGSTAPVLMGLSNIYYAVILAWALRWFFASFSWDTSWTTCGHDWNSENCTEILDGSENLTVENVRQVDTNHTAYFRNTPIEEFWRNHLLGMTKSIEDPGEMQWEIFGCLFVIWLLNYFSIWKGIGWTSKIVYFTATLPLIMMLVVTIRGLTLPGAISGVRFYLKPDISKLLRAKVWKDAAAQVLFTVGACGGSHPTLSGYNKFHHNFFRDLIIVVVCNGLSSFLAGFAIFSVLGFLSLSQNVTIDDVAESGPGLVFVIYPTALSLLPLPQLWSALFFLMIILLGFDTLFVGQETLHKCLKDLFPKLYKKKWSNEIAVGIVSGTQFLFGISMVTGGGIYVLHIFNEYAAIGWCMFLIAFCELITVGWLYGADKLCDDINMMLQYNIPRFWFKFCWKYLGPVTAVILVVYSLVEYKPLVYDRVYVFPVWANVFGWILALSCFILIPTTTIYALYNASGNTWREKFKASIETLEECKNNKRLNQSRKTSEDEEVELKTTS